MPDILVASDSASLHAEIRAVLADPTTTVRWVRSGPEVRIALSAAPADLAVVDMQIGTMGGIAVALDLRLEVDAGRLEACPVLLLLDRRPDVFLARRVGVEGWIIKPLDAIRIRRAVAALLGGGTWFDESYRPEPVAVAPAR
ncbi:MAG: response regulator [Acidimicrobiales bacterium]